MKISLNWLKQYVNINLPTQELVELIGARLVEIEEVIDLGSKYDNIFVAKVMECEKIPDTHLSLCQIDIGGANALSKDIRSYDEDKTTRPVTTGPRSGPRKSVSSHSLVQVVCGAPNVRKGMLAAWLAPGATVPQSFNQDARFIIGTRKLRGYDSHGMLAGADELDFGDDHDGIVELDPTTAKPGQKFADLFDLNDTILDVENKPLTRRPDTFGIIGFAREIAGILGQPFKTPDFLSDTKSDFVLSSDEKLDISIVDPKLCPRYTALIMSRKDDSRPKYLTKIDTLISRSGMRPIDPIVDLTNYLMLLTGQPLHAFDYDKLIKVGKSQTPKIIVRAAKPNEKIGLLDGREVKCTANDILITSNNVPVALAGAMGAKNTVIDENTKKIIIESATFSLFNLRKTQMEHGIFSEAITRFTKGQPAGNTLPVVKEFAHLAARQMKPLAIFDEYPKPAKPNVVKITTDDINGLLGTDYSTKLIKQTLENVGFTVKELAFVDLPQLRRGQSDEACNDRPEERVHKGKSLTVTAPFWRTDIHIKEDIIEEIGRLLGFDSITPTIPPHTSATKNPLFTLKTQIRNTLASFGANEILTYSFVSERLVKNAHQDPKNSFKIINSLSPDLQLFRQSLTPSLLDKAALNIKAAYDHFALFEMNKVYQKAYGNDAEQLPEERDKLALVLADRKSNQPAYYEAKQIVKQLLSSLNIAADFVPVKDPNASNQPYEPKRSAQIKIATGTCLGIVGEFKKSVLHNFKLPTYAAGFELSLNQLLELAQPTTKITPLAFADNVTSIDVTITSSGNYQALYGKVINMLAKQNVVYQISPVAIYQKSAPAQNVTFHIQLTHLDKGLDSNEINDIIKKLEQIK